MFRTILFTPNMIAPTITGLLFLFVFTEDIGLINNLLKAIGLGEWTKAWLVNISVVKPTVVIVQTWRQIWPYHDLVLRRGYKEFPGN